MRYKAGIQKTGRTRGLLVNELLDDTLAADMDARLDIPKEGDS